MYFWNYKKLAADLRDNAVSKNQLIGYALIFALWMGYNLLINFLSPAKAPYDSTVGVVFKYAGWIIPIAVAFYVNHQGDNKDFIKRYICFFLPITLRILVIGLVFTPISLFVLRDCFQDDQEAMNACMTEKMSSPLFFLIGILGLAYSLYLEVKAFSIASGKVAA